jgi:hypothetical protein
MGYKYLMLLLKTKSVDGEIKKSFVFWEMTPCSPLKFNRISGRKLLSTCPLAGSLLRLFLDLEDGGNIFLRNVS